jgi:DNA-binding GntR family transcriptional regulator
MNKQISSPSRAPQYIQSELDTRSLTERAYTALRELIISSALAPGEKLDVDGLSRDMGISRTPLKEALRRLEAEGLVTILSRRGSFVADSDAQRFADLLEIRILLEVGIARRVARNVQRQDIARLGTILDRMDVVTQKKGAVTAADLSELTQLDQQFHEGIMALAGNPSLSALYSGLTAHALIARTYYDTSEDQSSLRASHYRTSAEHRAILTSLSAGDWRALKHALRSHVQRVIEGLKPTMENI